MEDGALAAALRLTSPVVAVIGGGGKTSTIFRLAAERSRAGRRTLVTTTTHMWPPAPGPAAACDMGAEVYAGEPEAEIAGVLSRHATAFLGGGLDPDTGKVVGVRADLPARLSASIPGLGEAGAVLVEADGAAGRPLKRYRAGEPAWPSPPFQCVAILGIDAWGRALGPEICHRFAGTGRQPARGALGSEIGALPARFGQDELLAYCRVLADLAAGPILLFNRLDVAADPPAILAAARAAAQLPGVARVVAGSVLAPGQGFSVFDARQEGLP